MIFGPITPRRQGTAACCMHVLGLWRPIPIPCLAMHAAALPSHACRCARCQEGKRAVRSRYEFPRRATIRFPCASTRRPGGRVGTGCALHPGSTEFCSMLPDPVPEAIVQGSNLDSHSKSILAPRPVGSKGIR